MNIRNSIYILLKIINNSSIFSYSIFAKIKNKLFNYYFRSKGLYICIGCNICIAHTNKKANICIGKNVGFGSYSYIDYSGSIYIKNNITISDGVKIYTHKHNINNHKNWKTDNVVFSSLMIDDFVWLGANSIILPSVTHISEGSIIGAGSILTHNTEPYGIYIGNPAKLIKYRTINE